MMSSTERDSELIADLAAECRRLRKAQMVGIGRAAAADQTRLLGNRFDMLPVANPTRRRQCQYAFVDSGGSAPLLASTGLTRLSSLRRAVRLQRQ